MREIHANARSVRELLKGVKYSIDYYQREYRWRDKQVRELLDDLIGHFLDGYDPSHSRDKVAEYPHYFLGPIIISRRDGASYIVDGQQRLTSLTLLLMLLRKLQQGRVDSVNVDELIVSEKYGQKSFNLTIHERADCMEALYDGLVFDPNGHSDSVGNLVARYQQVEDEFPEELCGPALPYFVDWLMENVHLVEITAFSDNDAYTIFETMNDRGLSLTATEMLKGYLLTHIDQSDKRTKANDAWRDRVHELVREGKEVDADFFKAWLRSQYSTKIRERRRHAQPEDFDRIGTEFHRWLRDASDSVGLAQSDDFYRFIMRNMQFFSRQYLTLMKASREVVEGLEHVLYNAQYGFTLQYMLLLAPLTPDDDKATAETKINLVARYVDIILAWRIWNFRSLSYSTMQYAMFLVMRDIRALDPRNLAHALHSRLMQETETFTSNDRLRVHQQNRYSLHRLLARLTDHVETSSGHPSHYLDYVAEGPKRFEVEHIWADHPERHADEFDHVADFAEYRNRIGGLLLLPKKFNASYSDLPYENKLPHYFGQNLLARSLHPRCYEHNPAFITFVANSGLPFQPNLEFKRSDLDARGELYRRIASHVWNLDDLLLGYR